MPNPAPTVQFCAKALFRLLGITTLDPDDGENPIEESDMDDVLGVMNQALQLIYDDGPASIKNQPSGCYLHAPASVTLTCTQGSAVISAVTTWVATFAGCTIRIGGDAQDNEILSATRLARPYSGASGSVTATVYGDCVTLDGTVAKVIGPMMLGNFQPIHEASTRAEFITRSNYPAAGWVNGFAPTLPFFYFGSKEIEAYPRCYFVDTYNDPTLDYIPTRIRFSPMPSAAQSVGYSIDVNPTRIVATDIRGVGQADPGIRIAMPNSWTELVFLPIAKQLLCALPTFKNADAKPEIARQYGEAMRRLKGSAPTVVSAKGRYI